MTSDPPTPSPTPEKGTMKDDTRAQSIIAALDPTTGEDDDRHSQG
jgi:hypothetical protein